MAPVSQDGGVGKTSAPAFSPARLAQARRAAGLSNAQLAEAVGVRRQEVVRWQSLTTPRTPRPQLQLQLARALGVDVADLVEQTAVSLATLRRARGLTQADLAEQSGLPRSTIQALETGKIATLRPEHAERLAGPLQTTTEVIEQAHLAGVPADKQTSPKEPG